MNSSKINTLLSFAFAPLFILSLRFFDFEAVALSFSLILFVYIIYATLKKESLKTLFTPFIYFLLVLIAYYYSSMEFVKLVPAFVSAAFFVLFFNAYIGKKEIVLGMVKRFYKGKLSEAKERYIAKSDGYWAGVLLLNSCIQIAFLFSDNDILWAFYSSVGWYILMFVALVMQIVYGELSLKKVGMER